MAVAAAIKQSNSYRGYRSSSIGMQPSAYYRMGEVNHGTMFGEDMHSLSGAPFDAVHNGDGSGCNYGQPGALVKDNDGCIEYRLDATSGNYGGAGDYSISLRSNVAFTISFWAKQVSGGTVVSCRLGTGLHYNYRISTTASVTGWYQNDGVTTQTYIPNDAKTVGVWYHIAGVRQSNGLDVELFKNGESIGSSTLGGVTTNTSQTAFRIGSLTASGQKASGYADEMKVFHRALSATEIKTLYLVGRNGVTQ